jgi:hypothetical protein
MEIKSLINEEYFINNEEELKLKCSKRISSKSLGFVVHADVQEGRDKEFLSLDIIKGYFNKKFEKNSIKEFVIAQEIGKINRSFHYQCAFKLEKQYEARKGYSKEVIDGVAVYITCQNAVTIDALFNYCKKDGIFICSESLHKKHNEYLDQLLNLKTYEDKTKYLLDKAPNQVIFGGTFMKAMTAIDQIQGHFNLEVSDGYNYPDWLEDDIDFEYLKDWYNYEVVNKNEKDRRKGLVLFSKERAMGKTMFAKHIAGGNDGDYIICRGNFNEAQFNKPKARLLILDDMNFLKGQQEMWKALVTGEPVSIREAYTNIQFKNGLPCIITTNNIKMFNWMLHSEYFRYDCHFYWVQKYLGPPGTQRSNDRVFKNFMEKDLQAMMDMEGDDMDKLAQACDVINSHEAQKFYNNRNNK